MYVWPYFSVLILTFFEWLCLDQSTSLIDTTRGDFVNLAELFLTMWIYNYQEPIGYPIIYRLIPSPLRFDTQLIGLSRFCSEKGKKLLRNMPKGCSNIFNTACLISLFVRLATNNVLSQVTVNFIVNLNLII